MTEKRNKKNYIKEIDILTYSSGISNRASTNTFINKVNKTRKK